MSKRKLSRLTFNQLSIIRLIHSLNLNLSLITINSDLMNSSHKEQCKVATRKLFMIHAFWHSLLCVATYLIEI